MTTPRITVTLNFPEDLFRRVERLSLERWPNDKRAPRFLAVIETGANLLEEAAEAAGDEKEGGQ